MRPQYNHPARVARSEPHDKPRPARKREYIIAWIIIELRRFSANLFPGFLSYLKKQERFIAAWRFEVIMTPLSRD